MDSTTIPATTEVSLGGGHGGQYSSKYANLMALFSIISDLWLWMSPVFLILGIGGNLLSIVVLSRPGLRKSATSVFLIALAVADSLLLLTGLLKHWLVFLIETDIRDINDSSCKIHVMLTYVAKYMTRWILVCVSIERFIAVLFPTHHKRLFTRTKAIIIVAIMSVFFFLVCLQMYVMFGKDIDGACNVRIVYDNYWLSVWQQIDMIISSLLPFIIMTGATVSIAVKLFIIKTPDGSNKVTSLTRSLLAVNLVFLITTMPQGVVYAMGRTFYLKPLKTIWIVHFTTGMMVYVNSSVNFYLYVLTGRRFRLAFIALFKRGVQVGTSTDASTTKN